jgi:hypothetical protein
MLQFILSPEDMFWQEKMTRQIKDCSSIVELREIAVLLTKIATTRQVVIKGLVKDSLDLMQEAYHPKGMNDVPSNEL